MMLSRWLSAARRACADNSLAASQRRWLSQLTPADTQHAASPGGILQAYNRLVAEGRLQPDATQLAAVQALQLLQEGLASQLQLQATQQQQQVPPQPTSVEPSVSHASASNVADTGASNTRSSSSHRHPVMQGAYLWGPVGSGKTLCMDLFLNTLPTVQLPALDDSTNNSSPAPHQQHHLHVAAQRLHFHSFMLGVHQQLHRLQQALPKVVTRSRAGLPVYRRALPPEDPVLVVARTAAANTHLLCLDELHVTDVADAMLLSRLFGELLRCGCWVVFTSNRPARDLYRGGLSRRYFEPFVELVDDRLLQLRVAGGQDYRMSTGQQQQQQEVGASAQGQQVSSATTGSRWFVGPDSNMQLQQQWQQLVNEMNGLAASVAAAAGSQSDRCSSSSASNPGPTTIQLPFGRSLWVPNAIHYPSSPPQQAQQQPSTPHSSHPQQEPEEEQQQQLAGAYFTFEQLCGNAGSRQSLALAGALSATDYIALVQGCDRLFVEGVPQLQPSQRDEARRLVTLIDLLYEEHTLQPGAVQLCVSAQVPPHQLFLPLLGAAAVQGVNPNLGRAGSKLDVKALLQEARASQPAQQSYPHSGAAGSGVAGEDATVGGQRPAAPGPPQGHEKAAAAATGGAGSGVDVADQQQPSHRQAEQQQQQQSAGAGSQPPPSPPALLAEEVLMYHRASSRLAELCAVAAIQ